MQIRQLSINNANNNRHYEYASGSTFELIMLTCLSFVTLLTSIWLCCCCKKSKPKSALRQSCNQEEHQGEKISQQQHHDQRHHQEPSRHQHQQYRSRNRHQHQQHGGQERPGALTADGDLGKKDRRLVKLASEVQQPPEESIISMALQKPTSKVLQEVISLPSTDLAVPKKRLYLKKLATQRSPTAEQQSPPTPFDTAESVIPPPKRRPKIAELSAVPSPQPQDVAEAMERAAPAHEQSQAFKIYTETVIRKVQKLPQMQSAVQKKRKVVEENNGVPVENARIQKKDSEKKAPPEPPHFVEESVIKPSPKNKSSQHSKKKSALFKVYSETFMNKAAEHAPNIFPKATPKVDSSKILSMPNPLTPPPPPPTVRKSVVRSEPVPAGLMDYQTFFVVKENAMKASIRRSVQKKTAGK